MCLSAITKKFDKQGSGKGYKIFVVGRPPDEDKLFSMFSYFNGNENNKRQFPFFKDDWNLAYNQTIPLIRLFVHDWHAVASTLPPFLLRDIYQQGYQSGFHLVENLDDAKCFMDLNYPSPSEYRKLEIWEVEYNEKMYEGEQTLYRKLEIWEIEYNEKMYEGEQTLVLNDYSIVTINVVVANQVKPIKKVA